MKYLTSGDLPEEKKEAFKVFVDIDKFHLENEVLYRTNPTNTDDVSLQLVVPKQFRNDLMYWAHEHPVGGHFGLQKTLEKAKRRYFWPNQYSDVDHWVKTCVTCNQRKGLPPKAPLQPIPAEEPWSQVTCDIVGPFPATKSGNRYIVVFVDRFTGWPEAFPTATVEAPIIAELLLNHIIFKFGLVKSFLSDRGPQ